jgi:hypothetical protein
LLAGCVKNDWSGKKKPFDLVFIGLSGRERKLSSPFVEGGMRGETVTKP